LIPLKSDSKSISKMNFKFMNIAFKKILLIVCFTLSLSMLQTGCNTTKSFYKKIYHGISSKIRKKQTHGLRKKAILFPFINNAGLKPNTVKRIITELKELVENESSVIITKVDHLPSTSRNLLSPEFGISIDTDLARKSEELGMNIMISGVLNPVEIDVKKRGIWPFKKPVREITVSMLINVVNLYNGTLLLSNLETRKIKEKIKEDEELKKSSITYQKVFEKVLDEIKNDGQ